MATSKKEAVGQAAFIAAVEDLRFAEMIDVAEMMATTSAEMERADPDAPLSPLEYAYLLRDTAEALREGGNA
ncbi:MULTISPECIES: hypothetical protein [Pacificimonas]|uniref:Uncharacterized protein n=1 Tax=Pacificimonas aurantium TaxID=1250540 RepID=A0ABS7WLW7_9SPHN|nr:MULTISPECIES: hypothetical protein [Pacificimonas]MBZ6379091.1 hypothetical protein [Pacificimonas aurantium]